jgi:O-methyltransferase domain/Dimerisation domain
MTTSASQQQLSRLIDGFLTTQLLYVTAKLGIADVLAGGPKTAQAIADAVGADPEALARMLRGLVLEGVLAEEGDGRYALTELGAWLRDDAPGSMRGAVLARGDLYYRAGGSLLQTARDGEAAFDSAFGERFFDHLARNPDEEAVFQASMAARSEREAADVVAAYDFGELRGIVDVGGGPGILLAAILRAFPELTGTLVDRPAALAKARARFEGDGLGNRCSCVAGDFFVSLPPGADAYLLSRVIHDWDDGDALRILATFRESMTAESRLLLVEAMLPERAHDGPEAVHMDLLMLLLFGEARERTEAQYRRLLEAGGFGVTGIFPTRSPAGLSIIEAKAQLGPRVE